MFVKPEGTNGNGIAQLGDREILILFTEASHPPKDMLARVDTMVGTDTEVSELVDMYDIKPQTASQVLLKWEARQ